MGAPPPVAAAAVTPAAQQSPAGNSAAHGVHTLHEMQRHKSSPCSYFPAGLSLTKPYEMDDMLLPLCRTIVLQSENALLESPTGTGKTLCLLCATLAWRQAFMKRVSSAVN
jgi:Rad3-related DNA helicase